MNMYTQQDVDAARRQLRHYLIILFALTAALMAGYIFALVMRSQRAAMAIAAVLASVVLFLMLEYVVPNLRYRRFLRDMEQGLSREMVGTIVEISSQEELQDGARVLPVRILLREEQDERFVYLNATKRDMMPEAGADVKLTCYGRHIRRAERLD